MTLFRVRALLFVAAVLLVIGVALLLSRSDSKPAARAPQEEATESVVSAPRAPLQPPKSTAPSPQDSAPRPAAPVLPVSTDEDSLATQMHALEDANPARALDLARQGQARWPASPRAPEFAATEVKCLYRLGNPSEGRGAAEAMVNKYPGSPWAVEVEKQTGAHPHVQR